MTAPGTARIPPETLRAVREKAGLLQGAPLGEAGEALAETAVERALAWCRREDVPEDMEQAVAALLLALAGRLPQKAPDAGDGNASPDGSASPEGDALQDLGAVKSIQRGDTTVTFAVSGGSASGSAGSAGETAAFVPEEAAALAGLAPWRRLGRLKRRNAP